MRDKPTAAQKKRNERMILINALRERGLMQAEIARLLGVSSQNISQQINRYKINARQKVKKAISDGTIIRTTHCTQCGVECIVQGHHYDYSKPLDVVWVCQPCHGLIHRGTKYDVSNRTKRTIGDPLWDELGYN